MVWEMRYSLSEGARDENCASKSQNCVIFPGFQTKNHDEKKATERYMPLRYERKGRVKGRSQRVKGHGELNVSWPSYKNSMSGVYQME
jgi:hypothetical protein